MRSRKYGWGLDVDLNLARSQGPRRVNAAVTGSE